MTVHVLLSSTNNTNHEHAQRCSFCAATVEGLKGRAQRERRQALKKILDSARALFNETANDLFFRWLHCIVEEFRCLFHPRTLQEFWIEIKVDKTATGGVTGKAGCIIDLISYLMSDASMCEMSQSCDIMWIAMAYDFISRMSCPA
jgi:hypothetical protein